MINRKLFEKQLYGRFNASLSTLTIQMRPNILDCYCNEYTPHDQLHKATLELIEGFNLITFLLTRIQRCPDCY